MLCSHSNGKSQVPSIRLQDLHKETCYVECIALFQGWGRRWSPCHLHSEIWTWGIFSLSEDHPQWKKNNKLSSSCKLRQFNLIFSLIFWEAHIYMFWSILTGLRRWKNIRNYFLFSCLKKKLKNLRLFNKPVISEVPFSEKMNYNTSTNSIYNVYEIPTSFIVQSSHFSLFSCCYWRTEKVLPI